MNILYYPRQHGKTEELIKRAEADPHGIIVTATVNEAVQINFQVGRNLAVPYNAFGRGHSKKNLYIDNLEYVLAAVFPGDNINTATMSDEYVNIEEPIQPLTTTYEY